MIDIQTVACFNTRSPILHLFLPIQCQIHNSMPGNTRFVYSMHTHVPPWKCVPTCLDIKNMKYIYGLCVRCGIITTPTHTYFVSHLREIQTLPSPTVFNGSHTEINQLAVPSEPIIIYFIKPMITCYPHSCPKSGTPYWGSSHATLGNKARKPDMALITAMSLVEVAIRNTNNTSWYFLAFSSSVQITTPAA